MKYNYCPGPTDTESRKMLNEKVLYLIDSGTSVQAGITSEDVYNAYTGDGGLHGLDRKNYDNYHSYSEAKKEIENGQFFTPPSLCQLVAAALQPSQFDLVADLTCGKGSFFNFFPVESNLYGCEIDAKRWLSRDQKRTAAYAAVAGYSQNDKDCAERCSQENNDQHILGTA